MPAVSEKQRRFMGAELARKRAGKKTRTGMSKKQLEDFASKSLGDNIQNITGKIGMGKDKFSHNINHPSSIRPRNMAINMPRYESPKSAKKVGLLDNL